MWEAVGGGAGAPLRPAGDRAVLGMEKLAGHFLLGQKCSFLLVGILCSFLKLVGKLPDHSPRNRRPWWPGRRFPSGGGVWWGVVWCGMVWFEVRCTSMREGGEEEEQWEECTALWPGTTTQERFLLTTPVPQEAPWGGGRFLLGKHSK